MKKMLEETSDSVNSSGSGKLLDDFATSGRGGAEPSLPLRPDTLASNVCAYQLVRGKRSVDSSVDWCRGLLAAVKSKRCRLESGAEATPCDAVDFERAYAQRLLAKAQAELEGRVCRLME